LHVEHVVPIKYEGSDDVANLTLACVDCNLLAIQYTIEPNAMQTSEPLM